MLTLRDSKYLMHVKRAYVSSLAPEFCSQESDKKKKSSHGTQGNTIHRFEGMQSRVSINSPVVLNLNKYIIKMVWGRLMYVSNDGIRMYKSNFTALVEYSLNIWLTLDTSPAVTSSELLYIGSIISCSGKEPMKNVRPQGSG